ncbi:unnamed protein product [Aphanomyces euteiches]|uniref:Uncharacterized protein n=2 Tax=Aphanomyces euteiches TaxID=100861 RepID=A0A6G0W783_9STRA|nr:hypothetical protein Ae201684_018480 [Aphanomyces euteiches]KAH9072630.1 hypothetical protein Ae201684P_015705 [Aphanomyces euteiches]
MAPLIVTKVLLSSDLMELISAFQPGVYKMVLDLKKHIWYLGISHSFLRTFHYCNVDRLVATMTGWYSTHGISCVPKLLVCLPYMRPIIAYEAAYVGRLGIIAILHREIGLANFRDNLLDVATYKRHDDAEGKQKQLEMVRFLHVQGHNGCTRAALNNAVAHNHVELVDFLARHRTEGCDRGTLWASGYSLAILEALHVCPSIHFTSDAMDQAAARGDLAVVRFLHERRNEGCTKKAMDWAAANGHLDVVRFLHENRKEGCSTRALDEAVRKRHWDIVRFLLANRTEGCTAAAFHSLIRLGEVETLKLLKAHVKLDKAEKRRLKMLREMDTLGHEFENCTIL